MKLVTQAMLGVISVAVISATQLFSGAEAAAVPGADRPMVRIAEIEIDPLYLDAYKAILAEEQEASVRFEPGVLMLHSVAIADNPTHIRLLEVYANRSAYEAHLKAPHFIKYKTATEKMVKSLVLIETIPIRLCAKTGSGAADPISCI